MLRSIRSIKYFHLIQVPSVITLLFNIGKNRQRHRPCHEVLTDKACTVAFSQHSPSMRVQLFQMLQLRPYPTEKSTDAACRELPLNENACCTQNYKMSASLPQPTFEHVCPSRQGHSFIERVGYYLHLLPRRAFEMSVAA